MQWRTVQSLIHLPIHRPKDIDISILCNIYKYYVIDVSRMKAASGAGVPRTLSIGPGILAVREERDAQVVGATNIAIHAEDPDGRMDGQTVATRVASFGSNK